MQNWQKNQIFFVSLQLLLEHKRNNKCDEIVLIFISISASQKFCNGKQQLEVVWEKLFIFAV